MRSRAGDAWHRELLLPRRIEEEVARLRPGSVAALHENGPTPGLEDRFGEFPDRGRPTWDVFGQFGSLVEVRRDERGPGKEGLSQRGDAAGVEESHAARRGEDRIDDEGDLLRQSRRH